MHPAGVPTTAGTATTITPYQRAAGTATLGSSGSVHTSTAGTTTGSASISTAR